jgi:hypothetical protein
VVAFHSQWLGIGEVHSNRASMDAYLDHYLPDARSQAEEDGLQDLEEVWSGSLIGMRRAMELEAELFVERTVFDGPGRLSDLLTDHHGYATTISGVENIDTFRVYGITEADVLPGERFVHSMDDGNLGFDLHVKPVTFPPDQRAGVLTLGAVLAARAHPVHPAPVLRGAFVLERIACEHIGQPPEGAEQLAPPDAIEVSSTNRERLEAVTSSGTCAECHVRINPLGFAFENYDSLGGWRDIDNGAAVDASGTLRLEHDGNQPFTDAVSLAKHLAGSDQVHDCYVRHWARFAYGHSGSPMVDPNLVAIQKRFRTEHDGRVRELLVDLATSLSFRTRKEVL